MSTLVDTNVLLRSAQPSHPQFKAAIQSVETIKLSGESPVICPQNLVEFWVVSTRPVEHNGLGFSVDRALMEIRQLREFFYLIPDSPIVFELWTELVVTHRVTGKSAHDARIVAAMKASGISRLLTFNRNHFARYTGFVLQTPEEVVSGQR